MKRPADFTIFVVRLAQAKRPEFSGATDVAQDAEEFRALARKLDRIHTRQCNGYRGELIRYAADVRQTAQEHQDENASRKARGRVFDLAAKYGFDAVHFQDDPRGLPIYIGYAPHMTANNYNTHGFAVPL